MHVLTTSKPSLSGKLGNLATPIDLILHTPLLLTLFCSRSLPVCPHPSFLNSRPPLRWNAVRLPSQPRLPCSHRRPGHLPRICCFQILPRFSPYRRLRRPHRVMFRRPVSGHRRCSILGKSSLIYKCVQTRLEPPAPITPSLHPLITTRSAASPILKISSFSSLTPTRRSTSVCSNPSSEQVSLRSLPYVSNPRCRPNLSHSALIHRSFNMSKRHLTIWQVPLQVQPPPFRMASTPRLEASTRSSRASSVSEVVPPYAQSPLTLPPIQCRPTKFLEWPFERPRQEAPTLE